MNNINKKYFLNLIFPVLFLFLFAKNSFAIRYSITPPSGMLQRGENYDFIINVDTEGTTITNGIIGFSYDTQYLEYITTTAGEAMTSVSTSQVENGKLILNGTNNSGFSGYGVFAKVTLKLIAGAPGETELCVLWNPENQPTPTTYVPRPTSLAKTGNLDKTIIGASFGLISLVFFGSLYFLNKNKFILKTQKKR